MCVGVCVCVCVSGCLWASDKIQDDDEQIIQYLSYCLVICHSANWLAHI